MVTINDSIYAQESAAPTHAKLNRGQNSFTAAFLASTVAPQLPTPSALVVSLFAAPERQEEAQIKLSDFLDIPNLVSDDEDESDAESSAPLKSVDYNRCDETKTTAALEVKRFIKKEVIQEGPQEEKLAEKVAETSSQAAKNVTDDKLEDVAAETPKLSVAQFETEKQRVMKIVVKYVSMKITNLFPPELPRTMDPNEMPLESFLMILTSRLQLSLTTFMKGIIYLFRYMDIIYLLRYLNQSNNFANYTEMGFCIKKLIIGCFKLTLARDRVQKDWSAITGLSNSEINSVAKTVINRLNGKLIIKNVEVVRMKSEIFRFVKMVTKTV